MNDLTQTTSPLLLEDKQGWNEYWQKKNNGGILYALIAEFYRKVIIRPTLNHFIRKYLKLGSELLHAGCGSGQVDVDIAPEYKITGLDISKKALEIYKESNKYVVSTLHASIFQTGLPEKSIDGIYNLGVMEHFTLEEIQTCLTEFKRILRPDGRLVIFWPPEFGLSVLFFKVLRGTIKTLTGKDVKFHPDEISRIYSKKNALEIFAKGGFKVIEYSFGPRDVWTYSIVVAQKS